MNMAAAETPMQPIDIVLEALRAAGKVVRQTRPDQWEAQCPAHDDRHPSMGVNATPTGKVLVCCQTGCTVPDITAALGLRMRDLFPPDPTRSTPGERAVYNYTDEHGEVLFRVVRGVDADGRKTFRQEHFNGTVWVRNIRGVRRVPYMLPQLRKAVADGRHVWVTEGEKDAENLQWHVDGAVTCNPMGAGSWKAEYNEHFRGAHVTIIADDDTAGRGHADVVATELAGIAASVTVVLPATGYKDISDQLKANVGLEHLRPIFDAPDAPKTFKEKLQESTYRGAAGLRTIPSVAWLVKKIIQKDSLFQVFGPSGAGKSFVVIDLACCVATGKRWHGTDVERGPVVYVVAEGAAGTADRIDAWSRYHHGGQDPVDLWVITMPAMLHIPEQVQALAEWAAELGAVMVIIDTYARSTLGMDENKNNEAGLAIDGLDTIRRATGAAVGIVHHSGYQQGRGRGASALYGAMETVIGVEYDATSVTLSTTMPKGGKQKNGSDDWTVTLAKFETLTGRVDEDGKPVQTLVLASDRRIENPVAVKEHLATTLEALKLIAVPSGVTASIWRDQAMEMGVGRSAFYRHLGELCGTGVVLDVSHDHTPRYLPKDLPSHPVPQRPTGSDGTSPTVPPPLWGGTGGTPSSEQDETSVS